MGMEVVGSCPTNIQVWQQSAQECVSTDHYHCLFNEFSQTVSGCIEPIWVEGGYCPLYNSKALKLDTEKCHDGCPNGNYRSFDVYKYSGCYSSQRPDSSSTAVSNITNAPPPSSSSIHVAAVVVPVLLIVIGVISAVFVCIYRGGCATDGKNRLKNNRAVPWRNLSCNCFHGVPMDEGNTEKRPLQPLGDNNIKEPDENQKNGSKGFSCENLLRHVNFNVKNLAEDTNLLSEFVFRLREKTTLALIGEWGSGKRTLAVQIAKEVESIEEKKFDIKVLSNFHNDRNSDIPISSQSTILLIPDLCRFCHTKQDARKVLNYLHFIAKKGKTYTIATFRSTVYNSFSMETLEAVKSLFPHRMLFKLSKDTLSGIVEKYHSDLPSEFLNDILQTKSVIGRPLTTILCIKNPAYRNRNFLDDPLSFIISELDKMRISEDKYSRMTFRVLVYIMLEGGTIGKKKLEDCTEHRVFAIKEEFPNKSKEIQGCVTRLLNGYLEETVDGTSYRILHDVITKCTFLVAMRMDYGLLFRECDASLLVDCIRKKYKTEKITQWGIFTFDIPELKVGIPTESYRNIAKALKQRNEAMMIPLENLNWCKDDQFQKVWENTKLT